MADVCTVVASGTTNHLRQPGSSGSDPGEGPGQGRGRAAAGARMRVQLRSFTKHPHVVRNIEYSLYCRGESSLGVADGGRGSANVLAEGVTAHEVDAEANRSCCGESEACVFYGWGGVLTGKVYEHDWEVYVSPSEHENHGGDAGRGCGKQAHDKAADGDGVAQSGCGGCASESSGTTPLPAHLRMSH